MLKKVVCVSVLLALFCAAPCGVSIGADALSEDSVAAPSAILIDCETGKVLYEKNSHDVRDTASLTKIMTLCLIFDAIDEGKLSYNTIITASPTAAAMTGSDIWLLEGEQMTAEDMIKAVAVVSANDAAVALAEYICGSEHDFVEKMNEKAAELGMTDTVFKNCNGLDEDGHVSSAYDIAIMSRELLAHEDASKYTSIWLDYIRDGSTQIVNTNKLLTSYDGATGLKTGTTQAAGACIAASAQRDGLSLIAVVLGDESTTDRFTDAETLLNYGFSNYVSVDAQYPENLSTAAVVNGMQSEVSVTAQVSGSFLVESGTQGEITVEISLPEEVEAPIEAGQKLGKAVYSMGGEVLGEFDITADEDVEEINFKGVFALLLKELVSM